MSNRVLYMDTETFAITNEDPVPPIVSASISMDGEPAIPGAWNERRHGVGVSLVNGEDPRLWQLLWDTVDDDSVVWVFANAPYDLCVFMRVCTALIPAVFRKLEAMRIRDVLIDRKLADNAYGVYRGEYDRQGKWVEYEYNLAGLARRAGYPDPLDKDTWRLRYKELHRVPISQWPEDAVDYAVSDVSSLVWADRWTESTVEPHVLADRWRQTIWAVALQLVSVHGIRTQKSMVDRLQSEVEADLQLYEAELLAADYVYWNKREGRMSRRVKKARERAVALWEAKGVRRYPKTKSGKDAAIDEDAVTALGDDLLLKFQRYSSSTVQRSRVAELYGGVEFPIHTRFETLLASGRVSSSSPNIQNRQRREGDRECFVPGIGWVFVDVDHDQLELCTIAQCMLWLFARSAMAERINQGDDLHLVLASELCKTLGAPVDYGYLYDLRNHKALPPPVIQDRLLAAGSAFGMKDIRHDTPFHTVYDIMDLLRSTCKVGNFGFNAGAGLEAFVVGAQKGWGVSVTLSQARLLKDTWLRTWPEFRAFFAWVSDQARRGWASWTCFLSERIRGGMGYTELANSPSQSLGADVTKAVLWALVSACYDHTRGNSLLFGCRVSNYVHDQYLVEVPDDESAHDRAFEVSRIANATAGELLPDVKCTSEPVLCRRWSKRAKQVWSPEGRLVPWEWERALPREEA